MKKQIPTQTDNNPLIILIIGLSGLWYIKNKNNGGKK